MSSVALGVPTLHAGHGLDDEEFRTSDAALDLHSQEMRAMRAGEVASVHSWELVTAVDGPGTRMTLFLSGCPLRCLYCHNPDTMQMNEGAVYSFDEIWQRLGRYRGIMRATGGGLTISGGEPLMQPQFVGKLLKKCAEEGIHTAVDTSGFLGRRVTDEMLDNIDLFLLDVKSGISETYKKVTGRELQPTIDFGQRLSDRGNRIWVRFVLVPGLTDAVDNVEAVAEIVSRWATVDRLEILPFHQMGASKWEELGKVYELGDVHPPTAQLIDRVRRQFEAHGLPVTVG